MSDATLLMSSIEVGEPEAAEKLLNLVYVELRQLAAAKMAQELPGQTLQPTALVHEAWIRLMRSSTPRFENCAHFFAAAAEAMRRILIDRARRKLAQRRGGRSEVVDLDQYEVATPEVDDQLLALNEALDKFAQEHPIKAELVKLRYFAGLTNEEAAQVLGVSVTTAKTYWTFARP